MRIMSFGCNLNFYFMECRFCNVPTTEKRNFAYSYDIRWTHFPVGDEWQKPCCKSCWVTHWNEATKFWDGVDEVMNRNKYFVRDKWMVGRYKDWDKEYWPVYGEWKRCDIEGYFLFPRKTEDMKHIAWFQNWLKENSLIYKYESR